MNNFQTDLLITLSTFVEEITVGATPDTLKCKFFPAKLPKLRDLGLTGFSSMLVTEPAQTGDEFTVWLNASTFRDDSTSEILEFSIPAHYRIDITKDNYKNLLTLLKRLNVASENFRFYPEFLNHLEQAQLDTRIQKVLVPLPANLVEALNAWDTEGKNTVLQYVLWCLGTAE